MKPINLTFLSNDRGNVLVVTILLLFAVSVIGATLASVSSMDLKISSNQRMDMRAFSVAEAGLAEAIHRLSLPDPTDATVGGWTGNIAIGDAQPYDPNWETRIFLTAPGGAPGGGGSVVTTGTIQDPNGDYLQYSEPNGANDILTIQHKWVDRNGDNIRDADEIVRYDSEQVPPENFISGFPVEIVTVTGQHATAVRTIQAEVTKRTLNARTLGALYVDKAVSINGNPGICGHNHDILTPGGTRPNGCFAYHLAGGHLPGVTTTGDDVDIQGAAVDVVGDPAPTDTSSTNPFYNVEEVLGLSLTEFNQLIANPDYTAPTSPMNGITYLDGDFTINSNFVGQGLIYVTGDLTVNGDFGYKGLIYVEGDLVFTGTPWILGSIVVRGTGDYNFSAGNAGLLYSQEAIAMFIGQSLPAVVLSWREL